MRVNLIILAAFFVTYVISTGPDANTIIEVASALGKACVEMKKQELEMAGKIAKDIVQAPEMQNFLKGAVGTEGKQVLNGMLRILSGNPPPSPSPMLAARDVAKFAPAIGMSAALLASGYYFTQDPSGKRMVCEFQCAADKKSREIRSQLNSVLDSVREQADAARKTLEHDFSVSTSTRRRLRNQNPVKNGAIALLALAILASDLHNAVEVGHVTRTQIGLSALFSRIARALVTKSVYFEISTKNAMIDVALTLMTVAAVSSASNVKKVQQLVAEGGKRVGNFCSYMVKGTVLNANRLIRRTQR